MGQPIATEATRQCIYCRSDGPYTAEHVIPEAFGVYGAETMVPKDAVCHGCNQALGAELDQILARDSHEGLFRAQVFPEANRRKDRFRPRRTTMRIPDEPQFKEFRGARLEVDWSVRRPKLLDQIIVRDETGTLRTFTLAEMSKADHRLFHGRPPGSIQVLARSPEAVVKLQRAAEALGARFSGGEKEIRPPEELLDEYILLEVEGVIDIRILRAVAKIGFNYLAYVQGAGFVLSERFDEMRKFVRLGERLPIVRTSLDPVLANETRRWRQHVMHLVLVERHGMGLRARVSLFNSFSYEVRLCQDTGLYYPLRSGHAFDPVDRRIHHLTAVPAWLWLPNTLRRRSSP